MNYRKEIDGLRAIAILPVLLFHAGFSVFSGGYVGVDVFFVISGYLITSIILAELEKDDFSLKRFYEKRARRILPALSLVILVTSFIAYAVMPANLLKSYANSVISVVTFTSNFHFFVTSGYFSTAAELKPLLHTWSLAVEEQYYLFFPLLLMYFAKRATTSPVDKPNKKKQLIVVVIALTLSSLLLSQFLASKHLIEANFYLIFSRAWELLIGSLIALLSLDKTKLATPLKSSLAMLGLAGILYAIFAFDHKTPFPSFYTLIPVIGTALVIAFSSSKTIVGKVLSNRLFVYIGLISYSLYLWHQPLFAFMRLKTLEEPSQLAFIIAILISFLLAFLTYRYIETPFRKQQFNFKKSTLTLAGYSTLFFIVLGLSGVATHGFNKRFDNEYTQSIVSSPQRKACHTHGTDYKKPSDGCRYFGEEVTWAALGDSQTVESAFALAKVLEPSNKGLLHLSFSRCPPALLFDTNIPGCAAWLRESVEYLKSQSSINNVLLGFRYSSFLNGMKQKYYIEPINHRGESLPLAETRALYWRSLTSLISELQQSGKTVHLLYPIPELPAHIRNILTPLSIFGGDLRYDINNISTRDNYLKEHQYILSKLDTLQYSEKLIAIKPFDLLCPNDSCPAVVGNSALYFDSGHLSIFGATQLVNNSSINKTSTRQ